MKTKVTAILDIGSDQISVFVGDKSESGFFHIKNHRAQEYAGFHEGQWIDPDSLKSALTEVIQGVEASTDCVIRKIYVGVPAEFAMIRSAELEKNYPGTVRISTEDVEGMLEEGDRYDGEDGYATITQTALFCVIDDDKKVINPTGEFAINLKVLASYTLCDKKFIVKLSDLLSGLGIDDVSFVCAQQAEALGLFSKEERMKSILLLDVGHRSSALMLARGDGLLELASFSMGKADILKDMMSILDINGIYAENLLAEVNLNLFPKQTDIYPVTDTFGFRVADVNDIVCTKLADIAFLVGRCLSRFDYQCPKHMPLYLTGSGILSIKGARAEFEKQLGRKVEGISPAVPNYSSPGYSVAVGLIEEVLRNEKNMKSRFKKLFGGIRRNL